MFTRLPCAILGYIVTYTLGTDVSPIVYRPYRPYRLPEGRDIVPYINHIQAFLFLSPHPTAMTLDSAGVSCVAAGRTVGPATRADQ
jgi:hypothetical protein